MSPFLLHVQANICQHANLLCCCKFVFLPSILSCIVLITIISINLHFYVVLFLFFFFLFLQTVHRPYFPSGINQAAAYFSSTLMIYKNKFAVNVEEPHEPCSVTYWKSRQAGRTLKKTDLPRLYQRLSMYKIYTMFFYGNNEIIYRMCCSWARQLKQILLKQIYATFCYCYHEYFT